MDFRNLGVGKVAVVTDGTVGKLDVMTVAVGALEREGVGYAVYGDVRVEPKDESYVLFFLFFLFFCLAHPPYSPMVRTYCAC
jgi:hypothetical protein